jgi:two-component system, cell cycle response regulator DivK
VEPLVLIVDDNEKNLRLARDVLRAAGMRTLEAQSGAEAISLAVEHVPDVVLMDLRLGDMDGADAARALAGEPLTAHIPVVALSALRLHDLPSESFAGSIEKPISVATFPGEVRRYVRC